MTSNPTAFRTLLSLMSEHAKALESIDIVVGLDSRGFLFGPHLALELNVPFVPVRKKGKLPGPVSSQEFVLEYGRVSTFYKFILFSQIIIIFVHNNFLVTIFEIFFFLELIFNNIYRKVV